MNYELVAKMISLQEDDELLVFAFGDDTDGEAKYVMLQYLFNPMEQDVRLGLDGLYIERDDQANGCHLGVREIRRSDECIEIYLTETGKQRLNVPHIVITAAPWRPEIDLGLARLAALSCGEYEVNA